MPTNHLSGINRSRIWRRRRAFTLVEMLVTVAVTLLVLLSLVNAFQWIGERVAAGRASIEMAGLLRGASQRLQDDLDNVSVPLRSWPSAGSGLGYLEYIEGVQNDLGNTRSAAPYNDYRHVSEIPPASLGALPLGSTSDPALGAVLGTALGDRDDGLFMTVRSAGEPFTGIVNGAQMKSQDAEVAWWVQHDDLNGNGQHEPGELVLRRRTLLVRPDLGVVGSYPQSVSPDAVLQFVLQNDISVRLFDAGPPPSGMMPVPDRWFLYANSLSDLARRENRFAHDERMVDLSAGAPAPSVTSEVLQNTLSAMAAMGTVRDEDVIVSGIAAFDVRVFDPQAAIVDVAGISLSPGDWGWSRPTTPPLAPTPVGAFVDLAYAPTLSAAWQTSFSTNPRTAINGPPAVAWTKPTYDTWALEYEKDGLDQNAIDGVDEGTNGLEDDNTPNGVDDPGERETSPPYPFPLRGLQVRIRIYDADTRQVRQAAVVADLTP